MGQPIKNKGRVGQVFQCCEGMSVTVVQYNSYKDVLVYWEDGCSTITTWGLLQRSAFKKPIMLNDEGRYRDSEGNAVVAVSVIGKAGLHLVKWEDGTEHKVSRKKLLSGNFTKPKDMADRLGLRFKSNGYGWFEIVEVRGFEDYLVKWDSDNSLQEVTSWPHIKAGNVRNKNSLIFGVGILDKRFPNDEWENGLWRKMLSRTHWENRTNLKNYDSVELCEDVKIYSSFYARIQEIKHLYKDGWALDKDVLSVHYGKSIKYSRETLTFLPRELNHYCCVFGDGVIFVGKRYRAQADDMNLGLYDSYEEAHAVYSKFKKSRLNKLIDKYQGELDPLVEKTLREWDFIKLKEKQCS